jgi:hypothetical protein
MASPRFVHAGAALLRIRRSAHLRVQSIQGAVVAFPLGDVALTSAYGVNATQRSCRTCGVGACRHGARARLSVMRRAHTRRAVPLLRRPDRLRGLRRSESAEPSALGAASASPAPQHMRELRRVPRSRGAGHGPRPPHHARPSTQHPECCDPTPTAHLSRCYVRTACRLRQQPPAMGSRHCPDHTSAVPQEPAQDRLSAALTVPDSCAIIFRHGNFSKSFPLVVLIREQSADLRRIGA